MMIQNSLIDRFRLRKTIFNYSRSDPSGDLAFAKRFRLHFRHQVIQKFSATVFRNIPKMGFKRFYPGKNVSHFRQNAGARGPHAIP